MPPNNMAKVFQAVGFCVDTGTASSHRDVYHMKHDDVSCQFSPSQKDKKTVSPGVQKKCYAFIYFGFNIYINDQVELGADEKAARDKKLKELNKLFGNDNEFRDFQKEMKLLDEFYQQQLKRLTPEIQQHIQSARTQSVALTKAAMWERMLESQYSEGRRNRDLQNVIEEFSKSKQQLNKHNKYNYA